MLCGQPPIIPQEAGCTGSELLPGHGVHRVEGCNSLVNHQISGTRLRLRVLRNLLLAAHGEKVDKWYDAESSIQTIEALERGYEAEYPRTLPTPSEELSSTECELV